ncbi:MAG: hypothetical protein ACI30W_04125 [Muribaculaceae bacterium]
MIDTILHAITGLSADDTPRFDPAACLPAALDDHDIDAETLEALSRIVFALRSMAWLGSDAPLSAKDARKIMTHLCAGATAALKRSRSLALRAKLLYIIDLQIGNPNIMQIFDNDISKAWRSALSKSFCRYTANPDLGPHASDTHLYLIRCLISYWRNVPADIRRSSDQYAALSGHISDAADRLAAAPSTTAHDADIDATLADLIIVHDSAVLLKTHSLSPLYEQKFKEIVQLLTLSPDTFTLRRLTMLYDASVLGYDISRQVPIHRALTTRATHIADTPAQRLTLLSYIISYISRANIETAIAHTFSNTKGNTAQAL